MHEREHDHKNEMRMNMDTWTHIWTWAPGMDMNREHGLGLKRKRFFKFLRKAKIKRNFAKFRFTKIFAKRYKINITFWENFMFL
jgi:hypothetical protein